MQLLALALAPGLAISLFIFHRDAYNREPKINLLFAFLLGALMIVPAILIERSFMQIPGKTITGTAILAFLIVALTEELSKFAVLRLYAYPRRSFDEPLDGIVYAVVISMGFATVENVFYVQQYGIGTAWLRMFLAVPAHASFAVLMGYYTGLAKFSNRNRTALMIRGILVAVIFHGAYDFFLFLQGNVFVNEYLSDGLLFLGALLSFIFGVRLSFRHLKEHRLLSQKTYNPVESLSIRKAFPNDIPLIRELTMKIWPATYGDILSKEQIDYMIGMMYNADTLRTQMDKGDEFILLYDGVQAVGFASFGLIGPGVYKLHKIYILPAQQGRGTGRYMINQLVKAMQSKHARKLQLNVNRRNKAISFYEKMGFSIIREEDNDIGQGYQMNDYVMEKDLLV